MQEVSFPVVYRPAKFRRWWCEFSQTCFSVQDYHFLFLYIFTDLLSIQEYHSLLTLICADFPFEPVQKTARFALKTISWSYIKLLIVKKGKV